MRAIFLIFAISAISLSCHKEPEKLFYDIMNQNFLQFTDTLAYQYGKFILIPNQEYQIIREDKQKFLVAIDTVIHDSKSIASSTLAALDQENLLEFRDLIHNNSISDINNINVENITNTGRYKLMPFSGDKKVDSSYAGEIVINRPYIANNKAIIFFSVFVSKAGITKAFLLKKLNKQWIVVDNIEVLRW